MCRWTGESVVQLMAWLIVNRPVTLHYGGPQGTNFEESLIHDDVIKWNHFSRYWPFMRGIPRTEASDAELWCCFDLRPNKRLSKQWWGWWFETLSSPLWRHCNAEKCAGIYRMQNVGHFVSPPKCWWKKVLVFHFMTSVSILDPHAPRDYFLRGETL